MKITTIFRLNAAVTVVVTMIIGLTLIFTRQQMNTVIQQHAIIDQIAKGMFELNLLTDDYLLNRRTRAKIQWHARYASLTDLIQRVHFRSPEKRRLLEEIQEQHTQVNAIFSQVLSSAEQKRTSGENETGAGELETRFINQFC